MSRGVLVAFGLLMAVPLPAAARDVYEVGRGHAVRRDSRGYGYGTAAQGIGFENGFEEGFEHGRKDAERGRDFNFRHHNEYRDGDDGYRRSYGPKSEYVRAFRSGYEDGYREAFEGNRYGRGGHRSDRSRYGSSRYGRVYDYQRDGRHRHEGRSEWCDARHDDDDRYDGSGRRERGRVIYEEPWR